MDADESPRRKQAAIEALAALISAADQHLDGDALAQALVECMHSVSQVFEASAADLAKVPGMSRKAAEAVDIIDSLCRYAEIEQFGKHPLLSNFDKASAYLANLYIGINLERCYLLCLNAKGRMITCKLIQEGTVDRSAVYMRSLAETALLADAKYVVLSHNHPGGNNTPSSADVDTTLDALDAMQTINVVLLDHVIIADQKPVSLRALDFPAERAWARQRKNDSILLNWFPNKAAKPAKAKKE